MYVTPLAGVWIEMALYPNAPATGATSLPLRECGLKSVPEPEKKVYKHVTPLAGVWIEISSDTGSCRKTSGHSPCGSVD